MTIRYYICPIVGTGTGADPYRPKIADYAGVNWSMVHARNLDGTFRLNWALVCASSADFTLVDADPLIKDCFQSLAAGATFSDIKTFLQTNTIGNLPVTIRTAIQTYLTGLGVSFAGITATTSLWDVVKLVKNILDPNGLLDDLKA